MKYYQKYDFSDLDDLIKKSKTESKQCLIENLCRPGLYIGINNKNLIYKVIYRHNVRIWWIIKIPNTRIKTFNKSPLRQKFLHLMILKIKFPIKILKYRNCFKKRILIKIQKNKKLKMLFRIWEVNKKSKNNKILKN